MTNPASIVMPAVPVLTGRAATERYVELLTGSPDTPVCWRLYHDYDKANAPPLNRQGPVKDMIGFLQSKNDDGYAICIVINEGGHGGASIKRVRALFIDIDDGLPLDMQQWHVRPDFIVQRDAAHYHAYWRVLDCPLEGFRDAQLRLAAHYDSDRAVHDLPRVLRVPGFTHQKDPAYPHEIVLHDSEQGAFELGRKVDEILTGIAELPPIIKRSSSASDGMPCDTTKLREMLRHIPPDVSRKEWLGIMWAVKDANLVRSEADGPQS